MEEKGELFLRDVYPGRRSPTRFTPGYHIASFQDFEMALREAMKRISPKRKQLAE
jgi:hypothetical protein